MHFGLRMVLKEFFKGSEGFWRRGYDDKGFDEVTEVLATRRSARKRKGSKEVAFGRSCRETKASEQQHFMHAPYVRFGDTSVYEYYR
jgi:hypothetical protein